MFECLNFISTHSFVFQPTGADIYAVQDFTEFQIKFFSPLPVARLDTELLTVPDQSHLLDIDNFEFTINNR